MSKRTVFITLELDPTEHHDTKDTERGTVELAVAIFLGDANIPDGVVRIVCGEAEEVLTFPPSRIYIEVDPSDPLIGNLIPLEKWKKDPHHPNDGFGCWVKDGWVSDDSVFSTEAEDATHILWFNQ